MNSQNLSNRAQQLLKMTIEQYISDGHPVASKTLAAQDMVCLSSATIRAVMADLEARGYLQSRHASSGRIPTTKAYRFFVNRCLSTEAVDEGDANRLQVELSANKTNENLFKKTSSLMAKMTKLVAVVSLPKATHMVLRHIELIPLSDKQLLVILILNQNQVLNRVIQLPQSLSRNELDQISRYLSITFVGKDINDIGQELLNLLQQQPLNIDTQISVLFALANQAFYSERQEELLLEGQSHLFEFIDIEGIKKLKSLFHAFTQKQKILSVLKKCIASDGVQIYIGEEAGCKTFEHCSMVSAPYRCDGKKVGVVGVIGPRRMVYQKVIPIVDISAKLLTRALN